MLKIAVILLVICLLWRWALGSWPWQMLSATSGRARSLKEARKLLNVSHDATREDILSAHRRRIAMVHPDKGGSNAEVHEANIARDMLLDELPPAPTEDREKPD